MKTYEYIEAVAFAKAHNITLNNLNSYALEQKDMSAGFEYKVRRVRTPAGVKRFSQPIGSIITSKGTKLANLKLLDPVYKGMDLVEGKKGERYDVGKTKSGWAAYKHKDRSKPVAEAEKEDELFVALDKLAGKGTKSAPKKKLGSGKKTAKKKKLGANRDEAGSTGQGERRRLKRRPAPEPEPEEAEEKPAEKPKPKKRPTIPGDQYELESVEAEAADVHQSMSDFRDNLEEGDSLKGFDVEWHMAYINRLIDIIDNDGGSFDFEDHVSEMQDMLHEMLRDNAKASHFFTKRADGVDFEYPEHETEDDMYERHGKLAEHYSFGQDGGEEYGPAATPEADRALDAVYRYSINDYSAINSYLRSGDTQGKSEESLQRSIDKIDAALRSFSAPEDIYVARQIPAGMFNNIQIGDSVKDPAFMSTSIRNDWAFQEQINRAFGRAGNELTGRGRVSAIHIKVPKGAPGAYIGDVSAALSEREFLLPTGTSIRIIGIVETPLGPVYEAEVVIEEVAA